ncbi:hypothetical protein GWK47_017880 [Chionoecetes opilio]|uniref:Fibronectin type-III domain-containing protein n=1 Tax=Chionoecetes opilio TaxID=41210 RepID=A0A8J4XTM7_CHIOP|nr:hypothetical protein GWK47_017880 [Chionoecetes opilio]
MTSNATYSYEKNFIALGPRHTLPSLTPATQYEVMVVVAAWRAARNLTCVADGKGQISAPVILRTEKTSDTSVFVRWKRVSLPRGCHVQYNLSAIPGASDGASGALETRHITLTGLTKTYAEVAGLEANVVYTIQVLARCTSQPYPSAYSSTLLVIPGKGVVGYGKVVAGGVVGAVVLVVMMVSLWRRKRRQPPPPCNASLPSASPSPPLPCSRGTADGGVAEDGATERLNNSVI